MDLLELEPNVDWLVEGVLADEDVVVLYGETGSYKTFLAFDLALSVAYGVPWHGRAVQKGVALYFGAEGRSGMKKRWLAWKSYQEVGPSEALHYSPRTWNVVDPDERADLISFLRSLPTKPRLIVFDTLADYMGGGTDEDKTLDMNQFVQGAKELREKIGATILIVHHTNKSGSMRGNLTLKNRVDTVIKVSYSKKTGKVRLTSEKARDHETSVLIELVAKQVDVADGQNSVVLQSLGQKSGQSSDGLTDFDRVILNKLHKTEGMDIGQISRAVGRSGKTLRVRLNFMKEESGTGHVRIRKVGQGGAHRYSWTGKFWGDMHNGVKPQS